MIESDLSVYFILLGLAIVLAGLVLCSVAYILGLPNVDFAFAAFVILSCVPYTAGAIIIIMHNI